MRVTRVSRNAINAFITLTFVIFLIYIFAGNKKKGLDQIQEKEEGLFRREKKEEAKKESHLFYDVEEPDLNPKIVNQFNGLEEKDPSIPVEKEVVVIVANALPGEDLLELEEDNEPIKGAELLEAPEEVEQVDMKAEDMLRDEDVIIDGVVVDRSEDLEANITNRESFAKAAHIGDAMFTEDQEYLNDTMYYLPGELLPAMKKPASDVNAPGEFGRPFEIPTRVGAALKYQIAEGYRMHGFNMLASDVISLHRNLGDRRPDQCKGKVYKRPLPTVTVIIVFYNEALSVLLRTMYSVLESSPGHLLKEVILVDDKSIYENLEDELEKEIADLPFVKLIRSPERVGVTKVRMLGAKAATGEAIVFLDSHCECYEGWLEPLLNRIKEDRTIIASPVLENINPDTFQFDVTPLDLIQRGGFDWNLAFRWIEPLEERFNNPDIDLTAPIETPAISGGAYCIDKDFFFEMGAYDDEMDMWGGEGIELSFRMWMCGGRLEILPCSHVGHIFRPNPLNYPVEYIFKNKRRVAEVWLDDYKHVFYKRTPCALTENPGNTTYRENLRRDLECKSFQWYIDNIYPELYIPDLTPLRSGAICSVYSPRIVSCLDSKQARSLMGHKLHLDIHKRVQDSQYFEYTKELELRQPSSRDLCLTVDQSTIGLIINQCAYPYLKKDGVPDTQKWDVREDGTIVSKATGQCITADPRRIWMEDCSKKVDIRQLWKWKEN